VAVAEFIAGRLGFAGIAVLVEAGLELAARRNLLAEPQTVDAAIDVDHITRRLVRDLLPQIAAKAH
jgi:1-deoxy-D-xylulose 5-phosphate reductoisomerase